jgi:cytoskeletal protein RodZ
MGPAVELVDDSRGTVLPPTFGASLRAARLRRNISLDTVAAHTKINRSFFQDLERNDLSRWPTSQFYRETYLRAYSRAIGLDPHEVIDGFRREIAGSAVSRPTLPPDRPRRLTPVTIPIILAVTLAVSYSLARWLPSTPGGTEPVDVTEASGPGTAAAASSATVPATANVAPVNASMSAAPPTDPTVAPPVETTPPAVGRIAGELVITSTPPGANVLVNGIRRGSTPVVLQSLPAGSYSVRLILPGHTGVTRRATISAERRRVEVSADFEPAAGPAQAVE